MDYLNAHAHREAAFYNILTAKLDNYCQLLQKIN